MFNETQIAILAVVLFKCDEIPTFLFTNEALCYTKPLLDNSEIPKGLCCIKGNLGTVYFFMVDY